MADTCILYASNVAAAAGLHRYVSRETILEDMGIKPKEYDPYAQLTFTEKQRICAAADVKPTILHRACKTEPSDIAVSDVKKAVQALCKKTTSCNTLVESKAGEQKVLDCIKKSCTRQMDPKWLACVKKDIRSEVNTQKGQKLEKKLTDRLEKTSGKSVHHRNTQTYTMQLQVSSCLVTIRGRVDGLQTDESTGELVVVETKSRKNVLFRTIPLYEKIQMEVYMRLVGCNRAILNQHMQYEKTSDIDNPLSTLYYSRDNKLWDRVLKGLEVYVKILQTYTKKVCLLLFFFLVVGCRSCCFFVCLFVRNQKLNG